MGDRIRMALAAMKHLPGELTANMERAEMWFGRAMKKAPDFVGFPEFCLTGAVTEAQKALPLNSAALRKIDAWAAEHGVYIGMPFAERRGERIFNSCLMTGPKGRLGVMRKVNLAGEGVTCYTPGREYPIFDVGGCRMGVAICSDGSYYETIRLLAFRGAEVVFCPHAGRLHPLGNHRESFIEWRMKNWPLYASENSSYLVAVNSAGLYERPRKGEPKSPRCGGALVVDYEGRLTHSLKGKHKREGMLTVDLDLAALREAREENGRFKEFRPAIVYNRRKGWVYGIT